MQISIAVARICKAVGGPDLGQPDLERPIREYRKAAHSAPARLESKQPIEKAANAAEADTEAQADNQTSQKKKRRKQKTALHASADSATVKPGKEKKKDAKSAVAKAVQEPDILIVDELQEPASQAMQPKVSKKRKKSSNQKKEI